MGRDIATLRRPPAIPSGPPLSERTLLPLGYISRYIASSKLEGGGVLERRANANCRCGRPTTESSSFFFILPAAWCWCHPGVWSGPRPTGRCPDAVSFLCGEKKHCANRGGRCVSAGIVGCWEAGWVTCGQHHVALSLLRVGRSCTYTLPTVPTPAWKRPVHRGFCVFRGS